VTPEIIAEISKREYKALSNGVMLLRNYAEHWKGAFSRLHPITHLVLWDTREDEKLFKHTCETADKLERISNGKEP